MKKIIQMIILILIMTVSAYGQLNINLSQQIDSLTMEDQKWRSLLRQVDNKEIDSISHEFISKKINECDSSNFIAVRQIFRMHGYPGYDKVGESSSHNFWLLAQHADKYPEFQERVLIKMKIETEYGNASLSDYAYLVDRVKVNLNQLQVYGTQMKLDSTGTSYEPKPVIDPESLNERRKTVRLSTIEEYIQLMNEHYHGTLK